MNNGTEKKILLGLTTTPKSDWRGKTREIDELGLEEIVLFPTFIGLDERKELYTLLGKTGIKKIPHVHLRHDMEGWELDYFVRQYGAEVFNMHPGKGALDFLRRNEKYRRIVYVENLEKAGDDLREAIGECAGICLDLSHLEDGMLCGWPHYDSFMPLLAKYKIGCCHISAVAAKPHSHKITFVEDGRTVKLDNYSAHWLSDLSELDYVKKYRQYLPRIVSIELENPFAGQIKVKKYLEDLLMI